MTVDELWAVIRSAPQRLSDQSPKFDDGVVTVGTAEAKTTIAVCDITACSSMNDLPAVAPCADRKSRIVKRGTTGQHDGSDTSAEQPKKRSACAYWSTGWGGLSLHRNLG